MKKIGSLILICLLVFSLMSTISLAAKKPPVTLTICLPGWGNSSDQGLMEEVKKYMEQQNNLVIKMMFIPMNTYSDKLNVLLASGDIPDVFQVTKAMANVQLFAPKGYLMDIDKFVKKNKIAKKVIPEKYFDYLKVNGKVHAMPRAKEQEKIIWLRRDIADKYGVKLSSTPTTEEFYNEMKKIKDVIPFSFPKFLDNLPLFYNAFGTSDEIIKDKKGKYFDSFNTQATKDCLSYVNRLYKDGIMDKEFPTTDNTVLRNNLTSGRAAANVDYDNRFFFYNSGIAALDPNAKPNLQPIFKLVGPKGAGGTLNEAMQDAFAVGPKCKNPQAAVDFIAWMVGTAEGIKAYRFGLPEKHYVVENGLLKLTAQAQAGGMSLDQTNLLKQFVDFDAMNLEGKFPNSELIGTYNNLITKEISKHSGPKYVVPAEVSAIWDSVGPSIVKKRQEVALKIILGTVSVEDGFKEYEAYFKSINGEQMLKELNTKKPAAKK